MDKYNAQEPRTVNTINNGNITLLYRVSQKKGNRVYHYCSAYHYCSDMTISNSTVVRLEGILNYQGPKIFCA